MGACASKPNVLNGDAPEVVPENVPAKDATVAAEEEVKKEEGVIADDDANKIPSLSNLLKVSIHISMPNLFMLLFISLRFCCIIPEMYTLSISFI